MTFGIEIHKLANSVVQTLLLTFMPSDVAITTDQATCESEDGGVRLDRHIRKCTSKRVKVGMIMSSRIAMYVRIRRGVSECVKLTIRGDRRVCHVDAYVMYRLSLLFAQAQRFASLHDTLQEREPRDSVLQGCNKIDTASNHSSTHIQPERIKSSK